MRGRTALVRCLLVLSALSLAAARWSGEGTAYGGPGQRGVGACGIRENIGRYERYYASINAPQFRGSLCRRCVRITGSAGSVVCMVVDRCVGCSRGDVDMSTSALRRATGYSWDRKPVSWKFVDC